MRLCAGFSCGVCEVLTRRHFVALAAIVMAHARKHGCGDSLAAAVADYCASQNPRFDRGKFLEACEVTS